MTGKLDWDEQNRLHRLEKRGRTPFWSEDSAPDLDVGVIETLDPDRVLPRLQRVRRALHGARSVDHCCPATILHLKELIKAGGMVMAEPRLAESSVLARQLALLEDQIKRKLPLMRPNSKLYGKWQWTVRWLEKEVLPLR